MRLGAIQTKAFTTKSRQRDLCPGTARALGGRVFPFLDGTA